MLAASKIIFLAFFDICRFIKGPQDIPESKNLLTLCLLVYGICSVVLVLLTESADKAIFAALLEILLIMIFTQILLQIKGKSSRWIQTVTALSGTGVIISIIAFPIYLMIGIGDSNELTAQSGQGFGLMLLALLACWNILIMAHILRHALEVNLFSALMFSIAYILIVVSLTAVVIPGEVS
ncbi:MAG: hypothetical protein MI865_01760 [Proteobacteria bacterium]|nr:hypothetical protein [Pseudomonadota bacterium]